MSSSIDLTLGEMESNRFHRMIVLDRGKVSGFWTGTLETKLVEGSGCTIEIPGTERVSYLVKWFADNSISIDRARAGDFSLVQNI